MVQVSCECKRTEINGLPCAHIFALGNKGGRDPYKYLDCSKTMNGWRQQYCQAVRATVTRQGEPVPNPEWQLIKAEDADMPRADRHGDAERDMKGVPNFRDIPTDKLELRVREYPTPPTTARLEAMLKRGEGVDANLALPPVVRRARGRPASEKRKLGWMERGGNPPRKRAAPTCSNCQMKGHRKNRCPNMARAPLPPTPAVALAAPSPGAAGPSGGFAGAL